MRESRSLLGDDREGDVRAAMEYLRTDGVEQIVLIGSSLGGSNVLDVATGERVATVATLSVGDTGGWTIDEPGLYIASEGDGSTADASAIPRRRRRHAWRPT